MAIITKDTTYSATAFAVSSGQGTLAISETVDGVKYTTKVDLANVSFPFTIPDNTDYEVLGKSFLINTGTANSGAVIYSEHNPLPTSGRIEFLSGQGKVKIGYDLDQDVPKVKVVRLSELPDRTNLLMASAALSYTLEQGAIVFAQTASGTQRSFTTSAVTGADNVISGIGTAVLSDGTSEVLVRLNEVDETISLIASETLTPLGNSFLFI